MGGLQLLNLIALIFGRCTIDENELFYSYRREKEESGRMMGIIKLTRF
ncbi:MAG: hypothetical protein F6K19_11215 [Cyanothece sp. SIO1E1]|nr:hypothetical protein [Cyanothece sp. SIO1E1]